MFIIGVTGGIGHGKTTLIKFLAAQSHSNIQFESSSLIMDVANAWRATSKTPPQINDIAALNAWVAELPPILSEQLHVTARADDILIGRSEAPAPDTFVKMFEYLELAHRLPIAHEERITVKNKARYRPLLQWLGGYLAKHVDEGIWFDEIIRRIKAHDGAELAIVGGVRFPADAKRIRDAGGLVLEIRRPHMLAVDMLDVTERERKAIKADVIIDNNGNLPQLAHCARTFWHDVQTKHIKPIYHASIYES